MTKNEEIKIYFIEAGSPSSHIFSWVKQPRLGLVILATKLRSLGYDSQCFVEDIAELPWRKLMRANLIGISSLTSSAPRAKKLARQFQTIGIPVVLGGPHFTFLPDEGLEYADCVVRSEGEETIIELVQWLFESEGHIEIENIKGLSYKKNGIIMHNPDRPLIQDLDSIVSIPDLNLVHNWKKKMVIPIATSRGCPFNCKFCSVIQMFGRKYRFHSVERIIEEIKKAFTYTSRKKPHIFFIDDNFAANKERTAELLNRIISEGIQIEWSAQVRTDIAKDPQLVDLMKRAGCYTVFVGFESINPSTLKQYHKHQTLEDIENCITVFKKAKINIHGMFVMGGEKDDIMTIRETEKFAKRQGISSIQFLMLTPLPGTPVFEDLKKEGRLIHTDWDKYDAHHAVFVPKLMKPSELHIETLKAMKKFYSWGDIIKNLFQGKFFYAGAFWYGNKTTKKALKAAPPYLKKIGVV